MHASPPETGIAVRTTFRGSFVAKSFMTLATCTALLVPSPPATARVLGGTACAPAPTKQAPNEANVSYKTYWSPPLQMNLQLGLDVYYPRPGGAGAYPAMVVVHGGGWQSGCRTSMNGFEWTTAAQGFVIFAIDYRLACLYDPVTNPNPLCGSAAHPFTFREESADVRDAVLWVRHHAQAHIPAGETFTGSVAAVGGSAGGNLAYMAGVTGTAGTTKPDATAGLSGPAELGYTNCLGVPCKPDNKACDEGYAPPDSDGDNLCWDNTEVYMASTLGAGSACSDAWIGGSPACRVKSASLPPPTFVANATNELVAYNEAFDFNAVLTGMGVSTQLCSVGFDSQNAGNTHMHGTDLLGTPAVPVVNCDFSSDTVQATMISFLKAHL